MRAPASPFERYMSERILSFAYLIFRAQSAKRTCLRFAIFNFSAKLQNIFEIGLKQYGVFVPKSLSLKNYFKRKKNRRHVFFCLCVVNLPTVKFWGNLTNSRWVLAFYSVRFRLKNWFEKTALNMSITDNFYFQPKLKTAISLPIVNLFQWFLF